MGKKPCVTACLCDVGFFIGVNPMKEIFLTQDKVAFIDDEDFEELGRYKWRALKSKNGKWYATRDLLKNGKRTTIPMHRQIMNATQGEMVDHKDNNGLFNCKKNLRFCNMEQNAANQKKPHKDNKLGIKGVCWIKARKKYKATIVRSGIVYHLGFFNIVSEADNAYRKAEKNLSGSFTR